MDVTVYVDPICPYAWIASRWLLEVERQRPIHLQLGVMSLSVLNEHRPDLPDTYRRLLDVGWAPARVATAVSTQLGETALRAWYDAFGRHVHLDQRRDYEAAALDALSDAALRLDPAAASLPTWDSTLRTSHRQAIAAVGEEVGTPVLVLGTRGFFGPVLTTIPRGDAAAVLFDAVAALAHSDGFSELKRRRHDTFTTH